ncbi:MAG: asparagine synthase-related protein [Solirubrobacteraceae bacterium]
MHAFVIALGLRELPIAHLAGAVARVGARFGLPARTAWQVRSEGGALAAAGLHHCLEASPRRYLHNDGEAVTLFDGLPVDPLGAHEAQDAAQLAGGWDSWVGELEGQFCAVRLDLREERAQVLTDTFGLLPVFVMHDRGGTLLSNSVQAIRELLAPSRLDPLAVSTIVGFGWASARHTLLADVRVLEGGSVHDVRPGTVQTRTHFGPAQLASHAEPATSGAQMAAHLAGMIALGLRGIEPLRLGLTAGRDSRLLLAFVRNRGLEADCYTIGRDTDEDVIWARRLAEHFGFEHRTVLVEQDRELDWTAAAGRFLAQTDGLSTLGQLLDYADQPRESIARLGVKLWGIGSEIGRVGQTDTAISASALPLLGSSLRVQQKVLAMKADPYRSLMTSEAQALLDDSVAEFARARIEEGWSAREIAELFFIFERVACHGSAGPRRAATADDMFSPFASRCYTEFCLSRSAAERYVERPYVEMLASACPELYAFPFAVPLKPALPWLRVPRATRRLGAQLGRRLKREGASIALENGRPPFVFEWLEQHVALLDELFARSGSPLWELIDRRRARALLHATPQERSPYLEPLLRAATVVWYFDGPGVD